MPERSASLNSNTSQKVGLLDGKHVCSFGKSEDLHVLLPPCDIFNLEFPRQK
jgi:hypothetical protein